MERSIKRTHKCTKLERIGRRTFLADRRNATDCLRTRHSAHKRN
ncbi:unnamed protein product [Chondrus crispus]|uniref:Uncharacterized protein n=1 Tax=Chondrus crispus TaxID=2769 RepID=R7QH53_CHOCR|nr:unnamed protein product [Chondrus crispus]CDF37399.1 unnamed protein product [Chondrus crispus]|eukprot:XP_005717218.1 unnamed protein product [Chondrus crispus]